MPNQNQPLPILVLELSVSPRKNRAAIRKATETIFKLARRITQDKGGDGPWIFLAFQDAPAAKSLRLRKTLGLELDEDLWVELVSYPDRASMMKATSQKRHDEEYKARAKELDRLLSRRIHGYQGSVALAALQEI